MTPVKGNQNRYINRIRELVIFSMLGTLLYIADAFMDWAPNIHFLAPLMISYTLVYRVKALIPIYVYVFLIGLYGTFNMWWIPYVYIWTILWGLAMLIPRKLHVGITTVICSVVAGLHGFLFGILYAPAEALMFGLDFKATLAWIASGFMFDMIHGCANLAVSVIIIPLSTLLCHLEHKPLPYKNIKKT